MATHPRESVSTSPVVRTSALVEAEDEGYEQSTGFGHRDETTAGPSLTLSRNVPPFSASLPSTFISVPSRVTSIMPIRGSSIVPTRGSVGPTQRPAPVVTPLNSNTTRTPFRSVTVSRDRPPSPVAGPSPDRSIGLVETQSSIQGTELTAPVALLITPAETLNQAIPPSTKGKGKEKATIETVAPAPKKPRPKPRVKETGGHTESETKSPQGTRTSPRALRSQKSIAPISDEAEVNLDESDTDKDDYEQPAEEEPTSRRKRKRTSGGTFPSTG